MSMSFTGLGGFASDTLAETSYLPLKCNVINLKWANPHVKEEDVWKMSVISKQKEERFAFGVKME